MPEVKKVHFIGIGGASMSGLAAILHDLGYIVTGSDQNSTSVTERLRSMGIKVYHGHSEDHIMDPDLVVYTIAVAGDNPELVRARSLNIPVIDRAELLGQIMKKHTYSVAVSGTHGKTTTTSMISVICLEAGLDPTIHIGGDLNAIGGNTRLGSDKYFITEACEYCESFLKLHPYLAVILNIELDHADYFRDIGHVRAAFGKFASLVPPEGYLVANFDDPFIASMAETLECNVVSYGLVNKKADWTATGVEFDNMGLPSYNMVYKGQLIGHVSLKVPGLHNVGNSLAAAAACHALGCDLESIKRGLSLFTGTNRRFQLKGVVNGIKVFDDYAHHPTEIKATLRAARNGNFKKIWCVFQPHTYTRTRLLLNDFSESFSDADHIFVTDIYAAREKDLGVIHSRDLVEKLREKGKDAEYFSSFTSVAEALRKRVEPGDLVLTMGAGDVFKVGDLFLKSGDKVEAV